MIVFNLELLVIGGFRVGVCFGFVGYANIINVVIGKRQIANLDADNQRRSAEADGAERATEHRYWQ